MLHNKDRYDSVMQTITNILSIKQRQQVQQYALDMLIDDMNKNHTNF
jgi:hypothetical protein